MFVLQAPPENRMANELGGSKLHDENRNTISLSLNCLPQIVINVSTQK